MNHLADVGYQPEYGARELKRQIRSEVETALARAMLGGEAKEGDTVVFRYDARAGGTSFTIESQPGAEEPAPVMDSPVMDGTGADDSVVRSDPTRAAPRAEDVARGEESAQPTVGGATQ